MLDWLIFGHHIFSPWWLGPLDVLILWLARWGLVIGLFTLLRRLRGPPVPPGQVRRELAALLRASVVAMLFVYVFRVLLLYLGVPLPYREVATHGWNHWWFSAAVLLFGLDLYFYVLHRWLHRGWAYRRIHAVHHLSAHTGPTTSLSFHPLEAVALFSFLHIVEIFIPIHYGLAQLFYWAVIIHTTAIHTGVPILPWAPAFVNAYPHHADHHRHGDRNFGLIFSLWDRVCGTDGPREEKRQ